MPLAVFGGNESFNCCRVGGFQSSKGWKVQRWTTKSFTFSMTSGFSGLILASLS